MTLDTINLVTVPVRDQDASKRFYVDILGFTVTFDYAMDDGMRWVMLSPPGGGADITLATWFPDLGPVKLAVGCTDVDAEFAELSARGVTPNDTVEEAPWGRWFGFDDPDGNTWLVVQER